MTKLIEDIYRELVDDHELVDSCIKQLKEVFKDNKIDINDIPNIVTILCIIIEQKQEFLKLDNKKKHEILKLFIIHVLNKYNILTSTSTELSPEIENMLDACITLFLHESNNFCKCLSSLKPW